MKQSIHRLVRLALGRRPQGRPRQRHGLKAGLRAALQGLLQPRAGFSPSAAAGAIAFLLAIPAATRAQEVPARPAGVTDQQIQQAVQQRGLGDQIRQRIQQSGLTPDQIRARLRSAGYSENLIDAYITPAQPGQVTPPPSLDVLRAASLLGLGDFTVAGDSLLRRDSLQLSRGDSLFVDSLGLRFGIDSIPARRDSLGFLRLDSAAVIRLAERVRQPHVFGLDVFRQATTQFMPALSGPVDPEYQLGPGDELVLILTGGVELAYQLPVTREGFVVIPQVGQIYVANLTLSALTDLLYARLGRVYSGVRRGNDARTRFQVSVARVRTIQVFVTGEVARPGAYTASALGTVMNALYQAGGPTERGDFRAVRLMRGGRAVQTVDLYEYLLTGNTRADVRLEQGDVVFVQPRARRVSIAGSVLRPALYDLADGQGLRALIQMSGGLLPDAYTGRVQIERVLPPEQRVIGGRDRTVLDVDLANVMPASAAQVRLEPDDRVTVFPVTRPVRNRVVVRGNVWHPGSYAVVSGMRLSALIQAAGGLRTDTYLERAHIVRLMPDSTRRMIPVDLRTLGSTGAGGVATDPEMQEFDEVTVYSRTEFRPSRQVAIYGSVQRPGVYPFRDSMTVRDAVILAGGLRDEAYLLQAEISRIPDDPGGDTLARIIRVPLDSTYVTDPTSYLSRPVSARGAEPKLEPYDNVFIRRLPGWSLQRNVVISGEVRFPGRYTITRTDEKLRDLVVRAGGFTDAAYVRGVQFYRAESRAGRVGIDLEHVMRDPSFRDNLILLAGDSIYIPLFQPVVQVEGAVNSPVAVAYVPNRSASYYVDRAGGTTRRADGRRTYIVQPNGAVQTRGSRVEPGARVVVPEKPADEQRTNWGAVATTMMASLASLLSIIVLAKQL
jgi:protein involved in polysaccharide export with SLBB domain